jgi:hypothetical protein
MQLTGGSFQDFMVALSKRVFFWPGDQDAPNAYGQNFIGKYSGSGWHSIVLRVAFSALLQVNPGVTPYFCKFNSGAPRMWNGRKSPRGRDTFETAQEWSRPPSDVVEVSFMYKVILPDCTEVKESGAWRQLAHGEFCALTGARLCAIFRPRSAPEWRAGNAASSSQYKQQN